MAGAVLGRFRLDIVERFFPQRVVGHWTGSSGNCDLVTVPGLPQLSLDTALRHRVGLLECLCRTCVYEGPGVTLNSICGGLPTQHILWFSCFLTLILAQNFKSDDDIPSHCRDVGPDELWRPLLTSVILWFYKTSSRKTNPEEKAGSKHCLLHNPYPIPN